jgi:glycerol kinase
VSSRGLAAALDLGSTRVKLAVLREGGALEVLGSEPFPSRELDSLRTEIDVLELQRIAERLLALAPPDLPLGIASQRSSFVVFDRKTALPLAPALSWRDRRAAAWCEAHPELDRLARERCGLLLSPHYAAPKLATLLEADAELRVRCSGGDALFGTLETFLLSRWSSSREHATDATMAARTLLYDPAAQRWDPESLASFGVPASMLPNVLATSGRSHEFQGGRRLTATISDQASGLLAVARPDEMLVNLGTGAFVLRATSEFAPRPGYLCGPTCASASRRSFALEGTINGGAAVLDRLGATCGELAESPDLFCMPDDNGWGAPHWLPRRGLEFSRTDATPAERRRAWLEGLVFRVTEIAEAIGDASSRVLVSGGLSREPFVAPALASVLARPVELLDESESTLLGVARLAAGLEPRAAIPRCRVEPVKSLASLRSKFELWRAWLRARRAQ